MADPISWYALGRVVDDPQTILEAVDDKLLVHNQDPSAHGQTGESVYGHRSGSVLDHPYGSIHNEHVDSLSANKIVAGTMLFSRASGGYLNLGGPGQGLGIMRIYGPDGSIRSQADSGGFAVYGGKFLAQDDSDQTFLDAKGLVSTVVFNSEINTKTTDQSITGDVTWTEITELSHLISLARDTNVLLFGTICFVLGGSDAGALIRLDYGTGVFPDGDGWVAGNLQNDWSNIGNFSFVHLVTLPAGDNDVMVQAARSTPDEALTIKGVDYRSTFGYIVLGT